MTLVQYYRMNSTEMRRRKNVLLSIIYEEIGLLRLVWSSIKLKAVVSKISINIQQAQRRK